MGPNEKAVYAAMWVVLLLAILCGLREWWQSCFALCACGLVMATVGLFGGWRRLDG